MVLLVSAWEFFRIASRYAFGVHAQDFRVIGRKVVLKIGVWSCGSRRVVLFFFPGIKEVAFPGDPCPYEDKVEAGETVPGMRRADEEERAHGRWRAALEIVLVQLFFVVLVR
jgi:hypothetical protein